MCADVINLDETSIPRSAVHPCQGQCLEVGAAAAPAPGLAEYEEERSGPQSTCIACRADCEIASLPLSLSLSSTAQSAHLEECKTKLRDQRMSTMLQPAGRLEFLTYILHQGHGQFMACRFSHLPRNAREEWKALKGCRVSRFPGLCGCFLQDQVRLGH